MTKREEMAARADELLKSGEDPRTVAAEVGYRTVRGMLGAISLVRNRQDRSRAAQESEHPAQDATPEAERAETEAAQDMPRTSCASGATRQEPEEAARVLAEEAPTLDRVTQLRENAGLETYLKTGRFVIKRHWNERFARLWEIDHPENNVMMGPREIAQVAELLRCMDALTRDGRRDG